MIKISNSKKCLKKGCALLLASVLMANVSTNGVASLHAGTSKISIGQELEESSYSNVTKGIVNAMSDKTHKDGVLYRLSLALENDEEREYFLSQAIATFAHEQEEITFADAYEQDKYNPSLYIDYDIDDICVFDNLLDLNTKLPKQILLLTKIADFDSYSIYSVHDTNPSYVIMDKDGHILAYSSTDGYSEIKMGKVTVTPFKEFLESNGLSSKDSYSHLELFQDKTFEISESIREYPDSSLTRNSNVLVIDGTEPLTVSRGEHEDYYFVKYAYPYLFIDGRSVYKDPVNPEAKVTIDEENTLIYVDSSKNTEIYDLDYHYVDGGSTNSCLVPLDDFARNNDIQVGYFVSDELLRDLSKQLNKKGASLGIKIK